MFIAPFAVFATANWVHIPFEEAKMRRQFGATYDDYVGQYGDGYKADLNCSKSQPLPFTTVLSYLTNVWCWGKSDMTRTWRKRR